FAAITLLLSSSPTRRPPRPTLFPYTTLFRSRRAARAGEHAQVVRGSETPVLAIVERIAARPRRRREEDSVRVFAARGGELGERLDRKSTRLNSSHEWISYAVFCLKKKNITLF